MAYFDFVINEGSYRTSKCSHNLYSILMYVWSTTPQNFNPECARSSPSLLPSKSGNYASKVWKSFGFASTLVWTVTCSSGSMMPTQRRTLLLMDTGTRYQTGAETASVLAEEIRPTWYSRRANRGLCPGTWGCGAAPGEGDRQRH